MAWRIEKEFKFEAAHQLPFHDGKCRNLHGHSYKVILTVAANELKAEGPKQGMVMDFSQLSDIFKTKVFDKLDHQFLNDVLPELKGVTTAENLARWIYHQIEPDISRNNGVMLAAVTVYETATSSATYSGPN